MKTVPDLLVMFNQINEDTKGTDAWYDLADIEFYAEQISNIFELNDMAECLSLAEQVYALSLAEELQQ